MAGKVIPQFDLSISDLEDLSSGKFSEINIPESDYGLADIYYINGKYEVYEIPMYGGEPSLALVDSNAQIVLKIIQSWT